jgi:RNA polymerase sigma-70 factor (ECF subfamily)
VDRLDQIERAFVRLTPEHRAVLVLHHRMGLGLEEAASALGVPLGTVKSRLNRATASFRAALEAEDRETALMRGHMA